jgi:anti-anti-sigma factor
MSEFGVETRKEEGQVRVVLTGELDLAVVPRLDAELREAESEGPPVIVVDLAGLEFMDSSGLRALVVADERARRDGRRLTIMSASRAVRRVFEITKLDRHLDLVDDPSAAASP